eukprot:jgi/Mesen1/187/ME1136627C07681
MAKTTTLSSPAQEEPIGNTDVNSEALEQERPRALHGAYQTAEAARMLRSPLATRDKDCW